jgi:hypothetical protein
MRRCATRTGASIVLVAALIGSGCREPMSWVKEGPPFAAAERPSQGKALAYVYWPRAEKGSWKRMWIDPCTDLSCELLPGGYTAITVGPGTQRLAVESRFDLGDTATSSLELGSLDWQAEPGRTVFIRLGRERRFLIDGLVPRLTDAAAALSEIQTCRRSTPLQDVEIAQKLHATLVSRSSARSPAAR